MLPHSYVNGAMFLIAVVVVEIVVLELIARIEQATVRWIAQLVAVGVGLFAVARYFGVV